MKRSSVVTYALAAALFATAATPAMAAWGTRSSDSLPRVTAKAAVAARANDRFDNGRFGNSGSGLVTPTAFGRGNGWGNGGGFGGGNGLARLFSFLPPNAQAAILQALAGTPRGEQLCDLFGAPGCELPDSTG